MAFNKIKLNIAGTSYVINSADSEEHVLELANTLDTDMKQILEKSPSASVTAAAVICALTYLDKLDKSRPVYVTCLAGLRSYIACRILTQNGFTCKSLSGGYQIFCNVQNN